MTRPAGLTPEQRARIDERLARPASELPEIPRRTPDEPSPLSFAQQRLWFLDRLTPGLATYNMPFALELDGPLDAQLLARALALVVERHEALRTTIQVVDDQPVLKVEPAASPALAEVDLAALTAAARAEELERRLANEAARPFDLACGPLHRATLYRLAEAQHLFAFTAHHVVFDGWSTGLLYQELWTAYEALASGATPLLPELPVQYADYAAWQRHRLSSAALEPHLAYWKKQLAGAPPLLKLPTDRLRPSVQTHRGAIASRRIEGPILDQVRKLAHAAGCTDYAVLLAAFVALLQRYTGVDDLVVGSPIADRSPIELEPLIGFLVGTAALRTDPSGDPTFRELCGRVREVVAGAIEHLDAPLDRVVEELKPARSQSYSPLFQVLFQYDRAHRLPAPPGLRVRERWTSSGTAKFDVSLQLAEHEGGLRASLEYATDLFDEAAARRMLGHFETLLVAAVNNPDTRLSALALLDETERRRLLVEWNDTARPYRRDPVHRLVEEAAARSPDAPALVLGAEVLTYGELDRRANQLAHHLIELGAERKLVALAFDPSFEMVIAVLAVHKAGGACVPLDATHPRDRLSQLIGETGVPVLLAQSHLAGKVPAYDAAVVKLDREWESIARHPDHAPRVQVGQDDLAYVIYTSGSTGRPKGACLPHRTLSNLIAWFIEAHPAQPRTLQFAPLAFDIGFYEIFTTLCAGGTLVLADPAVRRDMDALSTAIAAHRVDRVVLPVVVLQQLAQRCREDPAPLASLRDVISTGEQLRISGDLVRLFAGLPRCRLHNHYGPSETHVVTAWRMPERSSEWPSLPPIGRPIANTRIFVLDGAGQPAPIGVPGELAIAGDSLARGYLERPELTAARFPDGEHGRLYRTGDLARWRPDGTLDFLGRLDDQVKLRGLRVELGEIEALLVEHRQVREAVALVREDVPGDQRLVAYVVAASAAPSPLELRTHLARKLPAHMIPSAFTFLPRLPLTPRGKVDRQALPAPSHKTDEARYVAPRNEAEARVAGIFAQLLGLERVGAEDNFFEIGGHSLLATQAVARVSRAFGVRLLVRRLFELPTAAQIVEEIQRLAEGAPGSPRIVRRADRVAWPVSYNQDRLLSAHRLSPGAPELVPLAYVLEGALDPAALERAATEIARRHEVLRASFHWDGEAYTQRVAPVASPLVFLDIDGDEETIPARAIEQIERIALSPVDVAAGHLARLFAVRVHPERHLLLLLVHHAVWDGASAGLLIAELVALHQAFRRGEPSPLPEPPFQYADFAAWQRAFYEGPDGRAQIAWWTHHLQGARGPELATDLPREPVAARRREMTNFPFPRGAARPPERPGLHELVKEAARRHGATPYELLFAVLIAWLRRETGQTDLTVATPHLNRNIEGTDRLIGPFGQALLLRAEVDDQVTFTDLVGRVQKRLQEARARGDVCGPFMGLSRFRINFNYLPHVVPADPAHVALRVKAWHASDLKRTFWYDLTIHATVIDDQLILLLWYNQELWTQPTADRWVADYQALLERAIAGPDLRLADL